MPLALSHLLSVTCLPNGRAKRARRGVKSRSDVSPFAQPRMRRTEQTHWTVGAGWCGVRQSPLYDGFERARLRTHFLHPRPPYDALPFPEFAPETKLSTVVDVVAVGLGGLLRLYVVSDRHGVVPAKSTQREQTKNKKAPKPTSSAQHNPAST